MVLLSSFAQALATFYLLCLLCFCCNFFAKFSLLHLFLVDPKICFSVLAQLEHLDLPLCCVILKF
jgi:hypothetical protein